MLVKNNFPDLRIKNVIHIYFVRRELGKLALANMKNTKAIVMNYEAALLSGKMNHLKPGLHISRKDRKHMFAIMFFELSRYGLVNISL